LLASLEVELKRRAETRLGIVVDADTKIAARWQSLRQKVLQAGYSSVPFHPDSAGTILHQQGRPTVGIWLMPDNTIPGMLEDFVGLLISSGGLLWPMADEVVQQVIAKNRRFPLVQSSKARIHTWLAWQKEPGKPMGQAITKNYFHAASPYVQQLLNWLCTLFDIQMEGDGSNS